MTDNILGNIVSVEARLAAGKTDRHILGNSEWMLQKARSGGGSMYNFGVHWIEILLYIRADDIAHVCAVNTRTCDKYDIKDSSVSTLKFICGAAGTLPVNYVPDSFPCGRDLYIRARSKPKRNIFPHKMLHLGFERAGYMGKATNRKFKTSTTLTSYTMTPRTSIRTLH